MVVMKEKGKKYFFLFKMSNFNPENNWEKRNEIEQPE